MSLPIRVLQGFISKKTSGLTSYICNNYTKIDKTQIQFDFLYSGSAPEFHSFFESEGACFYKIPQQRAMSSYMRELIQIMKNYKIVHLNLSSATFLPVLAAKMAGVQHIICHSHSTAIDMPSSTRKTMLTLYHYLSRAIMTRLSTHCFACSELAGKWLFGPRIVSSPKFQVMKNAIDVESFSFSPEIRAAVREREQCVDKTVFANIGRMTFQKNQEFLLEVFSEIKRFKQNAELWIIGDGQLDHSLREKAQALNLGDSVRFFGVRTDIPELMQAMDCFLLPSRFEGLPIVGVEAQAAGLPCVFSTAITPEVAIIPHALFLPLHQDAAFWATQISEMLSMFSRCKTDSEVIAAGYSQKRQIQRLQKFYLSLQ